MSDNLKFMQICGNCACIGYLGTERIRGPVDNVLCVDADCIRLLIENKYYRDICKYTPVKSPRKKSWETDYSYFSKYTHVGIAHHDPKTKKYEEQLKQRVDTFNAFLSKVKSDDNYYFTFNLNQFDLDKKTHHLKGNTLIKKIEYLKKINLLDKVIFVGTRLTPDKTVRTGDYWCCEMPDLIKKYHLKYVEIINLNIGDTEDSHKQFIDQVNKILGKEE